MLQLTERMASLGIFEADLEESFVRGSGPGGQKVNKTSSCVYLKHLPTGIEVKCQRTRSREQNRRLARQELCNRLEEQILGRESARKKEQAKIRKQKQRRSRRVQVKILESKRSRGTLKKLRKPPE